MVGGSLARTTVATTPSHLYEKAALTRSRSGRGLVYTPAEDTSGLTARRTREGRDHEAVLGRFVSQVSAEDERLLRAPLDEEGDAT
ncbi:BlaI/MecI/CopY family transcriptional regulator [Streptomyces goshikiensis]|uniref:BlaI/MecI/CopY family transcriptional regulator n=1 Tax=Streptomyces goshikiensis TaxID=1942 RepID=UPI003680F424